MLRLMARCLQSLGYQVITSSNGLEAWKLLQQDEGHIQAVLADISMPEMDGLELATQVEALPKAPPIILLSGYPRAGDALAHRHFLPKPFRPDQLATLLDEVLAPRA